MKPEAQRIAIAEACGLKKVPGKWKEPGVWETPHGSFVELPDYLNDLNAMHEAEKTLTDGQFYRYCHVLLCLTGGLDIDFINDAGWSGTQLTLGCIRESIVASPGCRAEAFLRTIGKWEDSK